jgi:glycosyltransferase involved in cell wall biosynthesis
LAKNEPRAHLLLVGGGPLKDALAEQAKTLGIESRLVMPGFRNDIPEILTACDAAVMSSVKEGFGLVLAEAMAAGLPVVATGQGGAEEVVENAGLFVRDRTPANLLEGMQTIMDFTTDERESLVRKADKKVKSAYSHEHAVAVLQAVYEECLRDGVCAKRPRSNSKQFPPS